jgi:hypothetical protein
MCQISSIACVIGCSPPFQGERAGSVRSIEHAAPRFERVAHDALHAVGFLADRGARVSGQRAESPQHERDAPVAAPEIADADGFERPLVARARHRRERFALERLEGSDQIDVAHAPST